METTPAIAQANMPVVELNIDEVKRYIAPNASDKELFMFMGIAKSYGLNPFKREIHFVKYGSNPGQSIVGYESYIKRAERTGVLDGWSVELGKDQLGEKATITIYRKDRGKPFMWTVYRPEFDTGQANWKKMPLFMLRKVAISQGFRLAFPEELGGMPYIPEEITGGASNDLPHDEVIPGELTPSQEAQQAKSAAQPKPPTQTQASEAQVRMVRLTAQKAGFTEEGMLQAVKTFLNASDLTELEGMWSAEATKVISALKSGELVPPTAESQMDASPY